MRRRTLFRPLVSEAGLKRLVLSQELRSDHEEEGRERTTKCFVATYRTSSVQRMTWIAV
jgi:hypothetical protein